jgi:predicted esterase
MAPLVPLHATPRGCRPAPWRLVFLMGLWAFALSQPAGSNAETVVLKNGMQLEGTVGTVADLKTAALGAFGSGGAGGNNVKPIVVIDDGLRRTLVPNLQVTALPGAAKPPEAKIKIPQRVAETGLAVNTIGPILRVDPFDEYGRRIFSMGTARGKFDVVQGITEVTPLYTRVQGLNATTSYVWDMRIATSSIPREVLSRVLRRVDPTNAGQRLEAVRLFIQADRIQDARLELEEVVKDFPEMAGLQEQVDTLRQIGAQRLIAEIRLRMEAGQHALAYQMAAQFPVEGVADATVLSIRDINTEYEDRKKQYEAALAELAAQLAQVEDPGLRDQLSKGCEEITRDLNVNTMDRLADFLRLADDKGLTADQKISLALSGWVLGSGAGTENTAVAASLWQVRDLVRDYLNSGDKKERETILYQLKGLEGSSPAYLSKIVAHMKPPVDPPAPLAGVEVAEDDKPDGDKANNDVAAGAPATKMATPPGLYEITVPGIENDAEFTYYLQLPPEYDPYRRYPCIVTLHGAGSTPQLQIDWWAGGYNEKLKLRAGQATRHGYIVLAPKWTKEHQQSYEYSSREHAAVLFSLRDAMQRFAIDSDRVFLSGHSLGGDAAWDIGLAHPDLWAGVIPIAANCEKYVTQYSENARHVPLYFVVGEKDGKRASENLVQWDRYLSRAGYDVMIAEYLGRGHEHFYDEILRLFEWMKLHQRNFFPEKFEVSTMRQWDNFFWFAELDEFPPRTMVAPLTWPPPKNTPPVEVEARRLLENNGLNVRTGARKGRIFLAPEMVDFDRPMVLSINGKPVRKPPPPSAEVLLEDVRTRGDRRHPFWVKIDFPVK